MGYQACLNCFSPLAGGAVCPRCGFDNAAYRPEPHHLPPGVILQNRYVVGRAMGQGGFGITYVGFNTNLDRRVAIKEYFPDGTAIREASRTTFVSCATSVSARERYHAGLQKCANEAKSLAQLDDIPGIVRVMEHFQENNTVYIIMEFVEGVTLVSYLKRLPQRPGYREALALLSPIGAALGEIHARGFVHRDVSPDNIMITRKGQPKLLDFGAVKTVTEGGAATESPVIKRGFSPAEMYSTDGLIGPWSDVYAYCATLYYILTGQPAPEPMNRLQKDTLGERLSRILSPAQSAALLKGLTVAPDQRYQTAAEMTAALNACRNDPAPAAKPEPAPVPATAVIDRPAPAPADDKPAPETELAGNAAPKRKTPPPAAKPGAEKQPPVKPAPEKAGVAHTQKADMSGAVITAPPKTGGKKKTGVIIAAAVTVIAALCVVIGIAAGIMSGKLSTTPTTQALSTTQAQNTASVDAEIAKINSANVGDYVTFGSYEQDNDTTNGKEDIEWLVLAKEDGKALLFSRYGLYCKEYNEYNTSVTWETCTLRSWLNGTFLDNAFSSDEQRQIADSTVTADKNPSYSTNPGNNTTDKIFLLSIPEAEKYFSSNDDRKCQPTAYAKSRGVCTNDGGCCWWWLRSPGYGSCLAAYVSYGGGVSRDGGNVDGSDDAVRPALWIDLSF